MDNPASSQSYDAQTQLLQTGIDDLGVQLLQKALDDFNDTGSILKMNRYITGFMMTHQMSANKNITRIPNFETLICIIMKGATGEVLL
jgi:hypothetical protein